MKAERIPLEKMESRKGKVFEKKGLVEELIKLVEQLKGRVLQNADARSLRELKVEANEEIVGVTADKNIAEPGSYQFEVVEMARKSSAMTSGFEDPDESYVGVGFVQYFLPNGESRDIYVDQENASLRGVAKLINKDPENGLRANVVNDGSGSDEPWRLIVSLEDTGDENIAHFPYFYFVDGINDFYLEFEREAQDAVIKLDGFEIELPENKTSDLIPGVTIDLKRARPGEEFTINIKEDSEAITGKISEVVQGINDILKFIKEQNTLDENSDTTRTLGGDITLQTIESRLRSAVFKQIETDFGPGRFGDLGITFQRDGLLGFDEAAFTQKLEGNFDKATQILVGKYEEGQKRKGFIDHLRDFTTMALRYPDGTLQSRKNTFQTNIDQIDRRIKNRERLLGQKEQTLKDKFARLEGTIARIKGQSAGVAALGGQASNPAPQLG